MAIAALLLSVLLAPDDTGEQFFKFPKDSVWTYVSPPSKDKEKKETKDTMTMIITGEKDGKVMADMSGKGERAKSGKMVWFVADGLFFWAEQKGEGLSDAIALYKPGSKKGDTWVLAAKKDSPPQSAKHMGTEEVKVPAGVYKDAVHTRVELGEKDFQFRLDVYLVEKVGVVKMTYTFGDQEMAFDLEEFKPAK